MTRDMLSIIIPAYNTGKRLGVLLNQLVAQITPEYHTEILVIDDGSREDLSFVKSFPNVIYKRKANGGAASARNVGLRFAHGEYITFVDSDDQVLPNYLEVVFENHRAGYDWCSYMWEADGVPIVRNATDPLMVNCGCCMYSFRADLIGKERFNERYNVREDQEWMHRVLRDDCKYKHDDRIIYNYTWAGNTNSLSHRFLCGELSEMRG